MSTIEDEARARLEEQLSRAEHYGRQIGNAPVKRATFNVDDVRTLLAASRRELSEASANVSDRPKDDISSGEMSVSEPSDTDDHSAHGWCWCPEIHCSGGSTCLGGCSDTDERWEYLATNPEYRRVGDRLAWAEQWRARGYDIYRRTKAIPAGEWEVVPDGE